MVRLERVQNPLYLYQVIKEIPMKSIFIVFVAITLVSCVGNTTQIASSNVAGQRTELDSNCKTLQAAYIKNLKEIDKLNAAMDMDIQEDTEISIQITSLGSSMGAESASSAEQMLAILNAVSMEHEKALDSCDIKSGRYPDGMNNQGERIAMIKVRNQQNQNS